MSKIVTLKHLKGKFFWAPSHPHRKQLSKSAINDTFSWHIVSISKIMFSWSIVKHANLSPHCRNLGNVGISSNFLVWKFFVKFSLKLCGNCGFPQISTWGNYVKLRDFTQCLVQYFYRTVEVKWIPRIRFSYLD